MINKNKYFLGFALFSLLTVFGCSDSSVLDTEKENDTYVEEFEYDVEKDNNKTEKDSNYIVESKSEKTKVDFVRSVDGDTIKVIYKGEELSVRMLLIDTPETKHPSKGVEPFGKEASEYAEDIFGHASKVELEFEGKEKDHYGRLLAYVWVDDKLYNNMIVEEGLARVGYIYGNKLYLNELNMSQDKAKLSKKNIWEIDGYVNLQGEGFNVGIYDNISVDKPIDKVVVEKSVDNTENVVEGDCDIKGNISSKGEKIYHERSGAFYKRTIAEEMFCSVSEAVTAGYRASLR